MYKIYIFIVIYIFTKFSFTNLMQLAQDERSCQAPVGLPNTIGTFPSLVLGLKTFFVKCNNSITFDR